MALAGLKITMTQAVHSSTMAVGGKMIPCGEAGGFVVQFPNGFTVYHAGDTAVFRDMELIRELYQPELALLPIGSHYVMNPRRRPWPVASSSPNGSFPCTTAPFRCSPARRQS